jgi:hypothetical protein
MWQGVARVLMNERMFKVNLHRGENFVLNCNVQATDVVTCIVQSRVAGDAGQVVADAIDPHGKVLVHFTDEYWGNIIIPVQAEYIQPSHVECISHQPIPHHVQ